jgi:CRISPR/Cas system-associated exonuclease Cas4 (RecB family)
MDLQKLNYVSYTSISALLGCSEKFDLRYIQHVQPIEPVPDYLHIGKVVDRVLLNAHLGHPETYDAFLNESKIEFVDRKWYHWCRGIWDGRDGFYNRVYQGAPVMLQRAVHFNILDRETGEIVLNDRGDMMRALGFIDAYEESANRIHEVKTGDPKMIEEYAHEGQTQLYCLGIMEELGVNIPEVEYHFVVKPRIRQRKNESEQEFYERMYNWGLFADAIHIPIKYDRESLIETARYLIDAVQHSVSQVPTKNRHECFKWGRKCEYFNVCWKHPFVMPEIKTEEDAA